MHQTDLAAFETQNSVSVLNVLCQLCGAREAGRGGLCEPCRRADLARAARLCRTPEVLDELRLAYTGKRKEVSVKLRLLSSRTGIPAAQLHREAYKHGWYCCARRKGWTRKEDAILREQAGAVSVTSIAAALRRGRRSVEARMDWLGLSGRIIADAVQQSSFTPDVLDELRIAYTGKKRKELSVKLSRLSARAAIPIARLKYEANKRGWYCAPNRRRSWSAEEETILRELAGDVSLASIARRLHRSRAAVENHVRLLGLSTRISTGYSMSDLAEVFGVDPARVRRWVDRGLLGKEHRHGNAIRVTERNVVRFLRSCPREYSLARVDQVWFTGMVFGGHDGTELRREKRLKKEQGSTEKQVSQPRAVRAARRIHPGKVPAAMHPWRAWLQGSAEAKR